MDRRRVDFLLDEIRRFGAGELSTDAARAQLDVLLVEELAVIAQGMRENLYEVIASHASELVRLKDSIERAASVADASNQRAEDLTKQLLATQRAYTWLTGLLVLATVASVLISALK